MIFTLDHVLNSIAGVLTEQYPEYPVYLSPNQQGTAAPCFFIFFMPSSIESQIDERFYRDLGIDIIFLQERNIINGNTELQTIANFLDENLETIPYTDGSAEPVPIRTFERQWQNEDMELHYQFHIRQRVSIPRTPDYMESMEETNAKIKHNEN